MASTERITEVENTLTLHIDDNWTANDFSIVFDSFNRLHNFQNLLNNYSTGFNIMESEFSKSTDVNNLPAFVNLRLELIRESYIIFNQINLLEASINRIILPYIFKNMELKVGKVKYGSKGSIDFIGIGKALETITALLTHYFPNEEKRVDILLKRKQIEEKEQDILQKRIDNLIRMGFKPIEIQTILGMESFHIHNIFSLQEKGQVIGIELNTDDK